MSNKSLDYLQKLKQHGSLDEKCWLMLSDLEHSATYDFFEMVKQFYGIDSSSKSLDIVNECELGGKHCTVNIKVVPCEDNEFDYSVGCGNYNDGTLLFYLNTIRECIDKVISGRSYCNDKYSLNEIIEKLQSGEYYILYEVGDIISTNTTVESLDSERPFLTTLSCSFLPLKYRLMQQKRGK